METASLWDDCFIGLLRVMLQYCCCDAVITESPDTCCLICLTRIKGDLGNINTVKGEGFANPRLPNL